MRFAVLEPPRTSAYTCSGCQEVCRVHHVLSSEIYLDSCCLLSSVAGHVLEEGSVQSNHPDLM